MSGHYAHLTDVEAGPEGQLVQGHPTSTKWSPGSTLLQGLTLVQAGAGYQGSETRRGTDRNSSAGDTASDSEGATCRGEARSVPARKK